MRTPHEEDAVRDYIKYIGGKAYSWHHSKTAALLHLMLVNRITVELMSVVTY